MLQGFRADGTTVVVVVLVVVVLAAAAVVVGRYSSGRVAGIQSWWYYCCSCSSSSCSISSSSSSGRQIQQWMCCRDSELVVRAQGPSPDNILFLVHEVFEGLILESFHGVTYDYLIPCPECLRLVSIIPHTSPCQRQVSITTSYLTLPQTGQYDYLIPRPAKDRSV